jgi:two-component system, cell cycle response regulator
MSPSAKGAGTIASRQASFLFLSAVLAAALCVAGGVFGLVVRNSVATAEWALAAIALLLPFITLQFQRLRRRLDEADIALQTMATTDALTGLPNRGSIFNRIGEELERHRRSAEPLCCVLCDVDHFKRVNDRFGHQEGDRVLKDVAEQFKTTLRAYDVVGRFGGEEFLVVLPNTDLTAARAIAGRLREAVETNVNVGGREPATASYGVALWEKEEAVDALLARADEALYRAKRNGRNRVEG